MNKDTHIAWHVTDMDDAYWSRRWEKHQRKRTFLSVKTHEVVNDIWLTSQSQKERIMEQLDARPTIFEVAEFMESQDDDEIEVRIQSSDGKEVYEIVGAEYDTENGVLLINCGAKVG